VKSTLRSQTIGRLLDSIVEGARFPLPRSLVESHLDAMWRENVSQLRISEDRIVQLLAGQGKTVADLRVEWTPAAEKRARLQLVIAEISKRESIGIEEEELDAEIARMASDRKVEAGTLKEDLAKNNLMSYMRTNLRIEKLYDFLLSKTTVKKGEKRKALDILSGN
jgi:FKBP-type peptidyl-prolyl cis-trans isomerase (trigger factor)